MVWVINFKPGPLRLPVTQVQTFNYVGFLTVSYITLYIPGSTLVCCDSLMHYLLLYCYINAWLLIMVATRFKTYQSSASSSTHYLSATCVSNSMAPSPLKNAIITKSNCYKGIPTKHSYRKIYRSVTTSEEGQQSLLTSPVRSTHVGDPRTQSPLGL